MRFESRTDVAAEPAVVWSVYADVERWAEWTDSITSVEWLTAEPMVVGARARVRQPRLPVTVWTVTEVVPGRCFVWEARGPGVRSTATHLVEPAPSGARATASIDQRGPLGPVVGVLTARLTRRYLNLEAAGLRRRSERGA